MSFTREVINLETEDTLEYTFFANNTGLCQFRVRASNDAHIALSSVASETNPMYEIIIGGLNNTKSVIKKNKEESEAAEASTFDILNQNEFREFWVRWNDSTISAGRTGEASPFLSFSDDEEVPIRYIGFCTGWGSTGSWVVGKSLWVPASNGNIPEKAFEAGRKFENIVYICRAFFKDSLIPGRISPKSQHAFISWGGNEWELPHYEVLCDLPQGRWVTASKGKIPVGAVPGGHSENKEILYIGRVEHNGEITVGKVQPSLGCLLIPYTGKEVSFTKYEVLVELSSTTSVVLASSSVHIPEKAFEAGRYQDETIYVCRANLKNSLIPGKFISKFKHAFIPWDGHEWEIFNYEMLSDFPHGIWVPTSGGTIPPRAIPGGYSEDKQPLYIGRATIKGATAVGRVQPNLGGLFVPYNSQEHFYTNYEILTKRAIVWVPASNGQVPENAFEAGRDLDEPIYICRAVFKDNLIPGKVIPKNKTSFIPWGGQEWEVPNYEVLCNFSQGSWVATSGGNLPADAVPGGHSDDRETLYIGRAKHNRVTTVGKIQPSIGGLLIPYGGKEYFYTNYEVLIE